MRNRDSAAIPPDTWGKVSAQLQEAERTGSWRKDARTFSEWLKRIAERRGSTSTLLWRYKSAGKFYAQRRELLGAKGIDLPKLDALGPSVSAEAVELLAKIARAAPPEVLDELEPRALTGLVTKKELRAVWDAYSPFLEGKTARGRGVSPPTVEIEAASRLEADVLLGLRRSKGTWLARTPAIYEVYSGNEVSDEVSATRFFCDALLVSRIDKQSPVIIHGVEVRPLADAARLRHSTMRWFSETVDFAWIAGPPADSDALSRIPSELGVLEVLPAGDVRVLRDSTPQRRERSAAEMLARDLLARSLRWWK